MLYDAKEQELQEMILLWIGYAMRYFESFTLPEEDDIPGLFSHAKVSDDCIMLAPVYGGRIFRIQITEVEKEGEA